MPTVLTLNGGSSSIRFAFYDVKRPADKLLGGKIDRIGSTEVAMSVRREGESAGAAPGRRVDVNAQAGREVLFLIEWLESQAPFRDLAAIGHRVVLGMQRSRPERITAELLEELRKTIPFDPEHLPREIELIESLSRRHPRIPQVACFDSAFHRTMPRIATLLPLPRRYAALGVQRYGFHGLSYTFLMGELGRRGDPAAASGRVVLAHLGNGASVAAVRDGACVDTSMGFTPASGLMMSTRTGDLDPGIFTFLALTESMDARQYADMVTHEGGLLGMSETSADVRDLLRSEERDIRAAEALELFCYQVKKTIGAYAAALGGLDVLVFSGGIGENAAALRARICSGLGFLGVEIDAARNASGADLVSPAGGRVRVRVMRTDEEAVIAAATVRVTGIDT